MIYTLGHSTLTEGEFLALLAGASVKQLWDVRSYPSSHWEWFRRERMEMWLPEAGVEYGWVPALGGRRGARRFEKATARPAAQKSFPPTWHEPGFVNYQWHMTTEEFFAAADELAGLGGREEVAVMCAEGLWWRCHRSMIADYLVVAGSEVVHLQPHPTRHAQAIGDRLERYDPGVLAAWRRNLEARRASAAAEAASSIDPIHSPDE
jgi:uncharacterized protein (DUF488 family)